MSTSLNIVITPSSQTSASLDKAIKEDRKQDIAAASKPRRIRYESRIMADISATLEITRNEPSAKVKKPLNISKNAGPFGARKAAMAARVSYNCVANPAGYLIGERALSSGCHVKNIAPIQLALFKVALKAELPSLPDGVLESITDADCKLASLTMPFYFEYDDETEAYKQFLNVQRHVEVVLNGSTKPPTRSNIWKKSLPRVHSDPSSRHSFTVDLPFGEAVISLKRELDEYPAEFNEKKPRSSNKLRATTRRLLCFEVKVELSKFNYIDSDGLDLQLPSDCRLWSPAKMPEDPAEIIWDAIRYELWFNVPLAVDESAIDRTVLNWQLQEVLGSYLAGHDVTRHERTMNDPKKFMKFREALIKKVNVETLIPWAIHKLNLSSELGPQLRYEDRYNPSASKEFAQHTLSKDTVHDAIERLTAAMKDKPGWMFEPAE